MTIKRSFAAAAMLGALMAVGQEALAERVTVTRCTTLSDGSYRPVLLIHKDGDREIYGEGSAGLTVSAMFDEIRAKAFIAKTLEISDKSIDYADCNESGSDDASVVLVEPLPEEPPFEEIPDDGEPFEEGRPPV
jgi:hypothetical protein